MKIVFAVSEDGDWQRLYIDGKRKLESEFISVEEALDAVGLEYKTLAVIVETGDRLPSDLSNVVSADEYRALSLEAEARVLRHKADLLEAEAHAA